MKTKATKNIEVDEAIREIGDTEKRVRFYENYFGMRAQTFTCPNEFEMTEKSLRFTFDSWISIESFERGDAPVQRLRKEFPITDDFEQIKNDNPFFSELLEVCLKICNIGGRGYKVKRVFLTTVGKFLTIAASSADGGNCPTANKYLGDYDQVIAENLEIIGQVVAFMITYGKTHDEFLAQSDLISE